MDGSEDETRNGRRATAAPRCRVSEPRGLQQDAGWERDERRRTSSAWTARARAPTLSFTHTSPCAQPTLFAYLKLTADRLAGTAYW